VREFVLIDCEDGDEHDRYEELAPALVDAAARAYGLDATGADVSPGGLDERLAEMLLHFTGKVTFRGPYGDWRVVEEAS
jgi:hypothetical protein